MIRTYANVRIFRAVLFHFYTGSFYHELQIGPMVVQVRHTNGAPLTYNQNLKRFRMWHDPLWRR